MVGLVQLSKHRHQRPMKPAAVAVLLSAAAHDLIEADVHRQLKGGSALVDLSWDLEVAEVEQAALRMQLGKQHALPSMNDLRHREEATVAELGDEVGGEVVRPAELARHRCEVGSHALYVGDG